jgi:hypothetical protein
MAPKQNRAPENDPVPASTAPKGWTKQGVEWLFEHHSALFRLCMLGAWEMSGRSVVGAAALLELDRSTFLRRRDADPELSKRMIGTVGRPKRGAHVVGSDQPAESIKPPRRTGT